MSYLHIVPHRAIRARSGGPMNVENAWLTYLDQTSRYQSTDKAVKFLAEEIASFAKNKEELNLSIAVHRLLTR